MLLRRTTTALVANRDRTGLAVEAALSPVLFVGGCSFIWLPHASWAGKMTFLEVLFLGLALLSLILLGVVLFYYWFFRTFTRERFAFRVLLFSASLCLTVVI